MQVSDAQLRQLYDPKLTPATLTAYLDESWIPSKHLMFISKKVAAAVKRGGARLIVSVPPRHGKSRMLSIGGTVWTLENFPTHNIGLCTYGRDLSTDFSGAVRDQIELNPDKLSTRIRGGNNRIDKFLVDGGGGVYAFGLGGALTGRGFHVFFLDDFIKSLKEATSPTHRQTTWDWFTTTAYTRLEPGATVIIIATRWHQDDIIGRILKEFPGEWEYIRLPALAEPGDPIGRAPGEALFPERYDVESLQHIRKMLGSFWFSALYQQNPRDDQSKMADAAWLQYIKELPHPHHLTWARVWDFAGMKEAGDYSCGLLFGANKAEQRGYIADVKRDQLSPDDLDKLFKATAEEDGKGVQIIICQEPGASGIIATNHFKGLVPGHIVKGVPELQNKVSKAHGVLAGAERGDLYLYGAAWNKAFADEFDSFPGGEHDDQIDCAAVAWTQLIGSPKITTTWGRAAATTAAVVGAGRSLVNGITWGRRRSGLYVRN